MRRPVVRIDSLLGSLLLAAAVVASAGQWALGADPPPSAATPTAVPAQEQLEREFEDTLSGSVLTGRFTLSDAPKDAPLKEEKYTLEKVTKVAGNTWLFQTRIQYGDHDVTVPLPLEVRWAGDTPIITLTDMLVPGLGTFTARVIIFRGQYAGTWSGGNHGGHVFGTIQKIDRPKAEAK